MRAMNANCGKPPLQPEGWPCTPIARLLFSIFTVPAMSHPQRDPEKPA